MMFGNDFLRVSLTFSFFAFFTPTICSNYQKTMLSEPQNYEFGGEKQCFQSCRAILSDSKNNVFGGLEHCFQTARVMLLTNQSNAIEVTEYSSRPYGALLHRVRNNAP